jgi:hypothetical protein
VVQIEDVPPEAGYVENPVYAKWYAEHAELARTLPRAEYDPHEHRRHLDAAHALLATDAAAAHYGRYVVFHRGRILGSRPDPTQAKVELAREAGINPLDLDVLKAYDPDAGAGGSDDFY